MTLTQYVLTPSVVAQTSSRTEACRGVEEISGGNGCTPPAGSASIKRTMKTIVNILSILAGFIAVVMLVVGGLKYVTSQGDSNAINSAKNTILYAIIGLVVAVLAQIIV